jgi:putative ABC transport system substrate-binding protein
MRVIGLAVFLTVSLVLSPLAADVQQPKVYWIGVLSTGNPRSAAIYQALEQRLHELGYIEGQNLAIEFRNAEGKTDRLPGLAAELVRLNVDVIVVATDPGTRAAKEASAKIPIVIVSVNYDPVELGYINNSRDRGRTSRGYCSFIAS